MFPCGKAQDSVKTKLLDAEDVQKEMANILERLGEGDLLIPNNFQVPNSRATKTARKSTKDNPTPTLNPQTEQYLRLLNSEDKRSVLTHPETETKRWDKTCLYLVLY